MADFFYNDAGRLRSVWRLALYVATYAAAVTALYMLTEFAGALLLPRAAYKLIFEGTPGFVIQSAILYAPAALIAWGCAVWLEELPWRSLGWARHRGWVRDMLFGTFAGGVAVCVAGLAGMVVGGYSFSVADATGGVAKTFVVSGVIFLLGAAAEEMLFRGYPLQTLMRSWPIWLALIPVSVPFALVHLGNPNVVPGFTLVNTALAGAWLCVAYWRTRSLWFPLGLHFGWNWVQGALLGSPVSGLKSIAPHPLLHFADAGPAWIGGGAYGIEGGAACTLALVVATLFTWRTRLLTAAPEMKQYTDGEKSNPDAQGPPSVIPTRTRVHLVYLRPEGMLLTKRHDADWRDRQDAHPDYITSLGPFDEDELVKLMTTEYGPDESRWTFTRTEIRDFLSSDAIVLKS